MHTLSHGKKMKFSDFFHIYFYEIHSKVHSKPRMLRALHAVQFLKEHYSITPTSITDFGCGNGAFLSYLSYDEIDYLGIDNDTSALKFALSRNKNKKNVQFLNLNNISEIKDFIDPSKTILILNGVSHHLSNEKFKEVTEEVPYAAIIILDHDGTKEKLTFIQKLLQKMDKGKFIRPKSFFDCIKGYQCIQSELFNITSEKLPLWRYFINIYIPPNNDRSE
jgi:SAM-dependent methyltransferase